MTARRNHRGCRVGEWRGQILIVCSPGYPAIEPGWQSEVDVGIELARVQRAVAVPAKGVAEERGLQRVARVADPVVVELQRAERVVVVRLESEPRLELRAGPLCADVVDQPLRGAPRPHQPRLRRTNSGSGGIVETLCPLRREIFVAEWAEQEVRSVDDVVVRTSESARHDPADV